MEALPRVRPTAWSSEALRTLFPARFKPVFVSDALGLAKDLRVGGGRGYVAVREVEAGELLLVEHPLAVRGESLKADAAALAEACSEDDDYRRAAQTLYPAGASIDPERLATVWRLCAFETGIYAYQSIFNDDPDPNCLQLFVAEDERDEVWATRPVAPGEHLTLSYVQPVEASASRRAKVLRHHDFLPPAPDDDAVARLEEALDALEADLDDLAAAREHAAMADHLADSKVRRRARSLFARAAATNNNNDDDIDVAALRAALAWLDDLDADPNRGPHHPDAGFAAGLAAAALDRLAPRAAASSIAAATGRPWTTPAELYAARRRLQARDDRCRMLYDSRRWLPMEKK
ncbi:hypothetical protein CTAYLR_002158 [Chrysophaeum taylorii]|uniref:SET domain-containing protein n=1 Tax=Chrysophaeum taylorii TaxID=2483200 RepID=A0AAD7XN79_9STRA|nr:hypothetical protein CTAYLR_002158 [Chrysophaeum taylorii]